MQSQKSLHYIDETMPWALAKDEAQKDRLETVLFNLIDSIEKGAKLLASFLPETAERILKQTNGGAVTDKPEILFARLDMAEVLKKVEELHPPVVEEAPVEEVKEEVIDIEAKPEITFDDWTKLQFQVGEIIACEEVKKSKKLLCSQVQIGSEVKQIFTDIESNEEYHSIIYTSNIINDQAGYYLREYIEDVMLTQEEFAKSMGVSRQTISSLENGRYNPSIILAYKIAKFFDMTIEEVFIFDEEEV